MSTLQVNTIQTSTPAGVLAIRDSNNALTPIQPGAVQGAAAGTAPTFQDSTGTEIGTLCRAWVNFNGTGTVAIRVAFNVSSVTDSGTGNYTVNFTNALDNAEACVVSNARAVGVGLAVASAYITTTTTVSVVTLPAGSATPTDVNQVNIAVFA